MIGFLFRIDKRRIEKETHRQTTFAFCSKFWNRRFCNFCITHRSFRRSNSKSEVHISTRTSSYHVYDFTSLEIQCSISNIHRLITRFDYNWYHMAGTSSSLQCECVFFCLGGGSFFESFFFTISQGEFLLTICVRRAFDSLFT